MSGFLKVKTAEEVLAIVAAMAPLGIERAPLKDACGRVLAEPVSAPEPVPQFVRATMDGYAVRARDTFGASETLPALLDVAGEVLIGRKAEVRLGRGKAAAIPTGGMLPEGADAVAMVEYTYVLDESTIEVTRPVAPGDNILRVGEDIAGQERLFEKGRRLRPQDVGVLAAVGVAELAVYRRPRVAVISTGDEIAPVSQRPLPAGKVHDINSYTLSALIERAGAVVGMKATVPDTLDALVSACRKAFVDHDVVVLSGGSSVGVRDFTLQALDNLGGAELLVHGVAIRPGKPTILARAGEKIFWGLPGQPVSAIIICEAFVTPCLEVLEGLAPGGGAGPRERTAEAVLTRQLPSVHGRTDYVPVVLSSSGPGRPAADPVFGRSAMISILARADGYLVIPEHVEGLDAGAEVLVHLFHP